MILPKSFFNTDLKLQKEQDFLWATDIKERDNFNCVICGSQFHPNAHHIIPRECKEFRYELWNGITLCTKHHKFSRVISAHNAPFAFFMWLEKYRPTTYSLIKIKIRELLSKENIEV